MSAKKTSKKRSVPPIKHSALSGAALASAVMALSVGEHIDFQDALRGFLIHGELPRDGDDGVRGFRNESLHLINAVAKQALAAAGLGSKTAAGLLAAIRGDVQSYRKCVAAIRAVTKEGGHSVYLRPSK